MRSNLIFSVLATLLTIVTLIVVNLILNRFIQFDLTRIIYEMKPLFTNEGVGFLSPEPEENIRYVISLLITPFLILFYYSFSKYFLKNLTNKYENYFNVIRLISLFLLVFLIYLDLKFDAINFYFYKEKVAAYTDFRQQIFPQMIEWKVITVLYIFFLYLLSIDRPNTKTSRSIKIFTYIFIPLILVSIFFVNIFNAYSYPGATVHFNDVFNPMAQVFNGASILVDLSSIYGLYPHFLNPIFNLVGLSVLSYSIIMSGFICLSYLCIFLLIRKAVANSLLVCLGFFSLIFYHKFFVGVYIGGGGGFDPYFQYDPIRIIFPSVFLLLASFYLLKPNKFNYFTTSLVASTGVLWNLDSGVVTFASWLLLLTYDELFKNDKKVFFKKIARHLSLNIVLLIISLTLFSIYIHSRSGFYPDWDLAFKFQNIFYMAGFMMMPMPVFHVWNLIILTYILGLVYSFSHLYERKNTFLPKIIFVISILGLGLFSYYQGRSHDYNLTLVSYPSFILLTIFADRILQNFKSSAIELKLIYFVCIFLFVIPIQVIFFQGKALVVYEQILRGINSLNKDSTSPLQRENFQFIKNNTSPNDKILILCAPHEQGIYYLSTNTQSAIRTPGSTGVPLVEDEHKLRLLLASANNIKIFADFSVVDPKVKLILESDYIFKGQVSASGMKFYEGKNCPPSRLLPDKNLQMKQLPGHNRECWVYLAGQVP